MTFIKFCGMTRDADVRVACELGVNAIGFVMWPHSPRYVDARQVAALVRVMPADILPVAVLVTPSAEEVATARAAGARAVQIHGDIREWPDGEVWVATTVDGDLDAIPTPFTVLVDANDPVRHGGTGRTIDWARAAAIVQQQRRVILAGGLTPSNVGEALRQVKPYGVDVSSGIENRPGEKSAQAMQQFVAAVREANQ